MHSAADAVQAVREAIGQTALNAQPHSADKVAAKPESNAPIADESAPPMRAAAWFGKGDVRVINVAKPALTEPGDVIIKVTSTCICGSDLHIYTGYMPGMQRGDVLGHEFMGVVEQVGPDVKTLKTGDRVVVAFDMACGQCNYCKLGCFTACDSTNQSKAQEAMYGHNTAGLCGYSHMTGGHAGGQADYARVPYADVNCLKVPPTMQDEQVVFLSDILPTAWHANVMGETGPDMPNVAIWGAGPVGILAAHCAFHRGAKRVVIIDRVQERLDWATAAIPGLETLNFSKVNVEDELKRMFPDFKGPDVCIEAVGFHYAKSWLHYVEQKLGLETDSADILNEIIRCCRKNGTVSVVGVYAGFTNHFNIGAFMEKGLTMRAGQTPVQRYSKELLQKVMAGELKPDIVITHTLPLEMASEGYKRFNEKTDHCVKVILKPGKQGVTLTNTQPAGTTA